MSASELGRLAVTAQFTAAARAVESARPDALFVDPWAARLAGPAGFAWLDRLPAAAALWPIVRTRFLDDWLLAQREASVLQVVLVGAGFDTRAYRLPWPESTRIFEIDRADLLAFKDNVLRHAQAMPHAATIVVDADLLKPWEFALRASGFVAEASAIWIVEGLFMYLDAVAARHVLATISRLAAPGSRLGADLPRRSLRGHFVPDPGEFLQSFGWSASISTLGDIARALGRWPYPAPHAAAMPDSTVYLVAARRGVA